MTQNKLKQIILLAGILNLFFAGCGKEEVVSSFPIYTDTSRIEQKSENVSIDAAISVPESARSGEVFWSQGTNMNFDEKQNDLKKDFLQGSTQPQFERLDDTEFFSWTDYSEDDNWRILAYNNMREFILNTQEGQYRKSCITLLKDSDNYNGDLYTEQENLDFMTRENAVSYVRETMEKYGIHLGKPVSVYAMDYQTMRQEEDVTDLDGNPQPDQAKAEWDSEDDTYYMFFYQEYQGMPIMYHMYSQEGFLPGEEAVVMMTKNGMIQIDIQGCYEWEQRDKVALISAEKAVDTFFQNYQGIYDTEYKVTNISLMLDIISGVDDTAKLWPVWVFETEVTGTKDNYTYTCEILIDAVDGREMAYS